MSTADAICHDERLIKLAKGKGLGSVTPTILDLMNIPIPGGMQEDSLIVKE